MPVGIHLSIIDRIEFDSVRLGLTGTLLGQLAIGVLGILVITAECGTGSIRSTLAAIPNRPRPTPCSGSSEGSTS